MRAVVLAILVAVAVTARPAAAQTRQQQWEACQDAADRDRAIAGCTALIQSGQETMEHLAVAFNNRGYAYSTTGQYDRAIADFDQAVRLDPKFTLALNNRGDAHNQADRQSDRAIADFDQAIRLDPGFASAFNNRCWSRAILGLLPEALADCDKSLRLRPNSAATLDSRGFVHLRMERPDQAMADYDAALALRPGVATSLYGRGLAHLKQGDSAAADRDFAAAKGINSDIATRFRRWGVTGP